MINISTNQNKIMRKKFQLFILSLSFQSSQPKNLLTWKLMKIKKWILNMNYSHGWAEGEKLFLSNLYGKIISYSFLKYCTFLQNWVKKSFVNNSSKINALCAVFECFPPKKLITLFKFSSSVFKNPLYMALLTIL